MPLTTTMRRFCLAHAEAFVVPAEMLGEQGMDPLCAEQLLAEDRLTQAQLRCLEQGFALYWRRALELFKKAPGSWFPPRQVNLLIVSDAGAVPPYFDPFAGSSSLIYLSDLDSHPEYVAYQLIHNERISLLHSMRAALICNLSYWLQRDDASRQAFRSAARQASRPDAAIFVQLGEALEWIGAIGHATLNPPDPDATEPYLPVAAAELFVPKRLQVALVELCDMAEAMLRQAMQAVTTRRAAQPTRASQALDALCDWIIEVQAELIVRDADGKTVWHPECRDSSALRKALSGAADEAVASLGADFRVVHERSRSFLAALGDRADLPRHCPVLVEGDGAWLDAAKQAVVYELQQPGFDALGCAAPPFHRLLLGARVMHEWGHLAHAGRLLRVPDADRTAYQRARAELGDCFHQALDRVPRRMRPQLMHQLHQLAARPADQPAALARKVLSRVGDYLANLLCSRLLPGEELQAYVRTNVRHHLGENLGLVDELARYAYEVHYLDLASMPRQYFFATTRFNEYFVDSGLISAADTQALFDATGRVLACYAIDETRLHLPGKATPRPDVETAAAQATGS